jgi:hypothetical protein
MKIKSKSFDPLSFLCEQGAKPKGTWQKKLLVYMQFLSLQSIKKVSKLDKM